MDWNQWRELSSDYLEGTLSAEKRKEVEAFLAQSPSAKAELMALRGITQHLNTPSEVDPPLFFADNVMARIQREQEEAQRKSWRSWLPQLGKLAVGSLAAGGVMAAIAWNAFYPKNPTNENRAGVLSGVGATGNTASPESGPRPVLRLTNLRNNGAKLQFELTLENAARGMVLASVPGAPQPTGVMLGGDDAKTRPFEVPIAEGMAVSTFKLAWTGDGTQGEQWVVTPLGDTQAATVRRSFGLGEQPLAPQALEELARRYGQGITLVDVAQPQGKIRFDARNETLEELLRRHLSPLGMTVTRNETRVIVTGKS